MEYDIAKAQGDAYAQVESHAALDLLHRERHTDEREYEGCKRGRYALVILNFKLLDIGDAASSLLVDIVLQFGRCECLLLILRD